MAIIIIISLAFILFVVEANKENQPTIIEPLSTSKTTIQNNVKDCVEFILAEPNLLRYLIGFGIGFFIISGGLFLLSSIYMIINWYRNDLNKIERKLKEKNNKQ